MKRNLFLAIAVAVISVWLIAPINANACGFGKATVIKGSATLSSNITVYNPVAGLCKDKPKHRIEKATIRQKRNKTIVVLKNGTTYTIKRKYNIAFEGCNKAMVYFNKSCNRIVKITAKI